MERFLECFGFPSNADLKEEEFETLFIQSECENVKKERVDRRGVNSLERVKF